MSVCDRPFLRLFIHCRERKFVQLARPSDSLFDLASNIQTKYAKLYAGRELRSARLQCADGFDLDFDDVVADVFEDRDHVYIDVCHPTDSIMSPSKRRCFQSPASSSAMTTPERSGVMGPTGGSPIKQKITPVSSLPNLIADGRKETATNKSDDGDGSSTECAPLIEEFALKPKQSNKEQTANPLAQEPKEQGSNQNKDVDSPVPSGKPQKSAAAKKRAAAKKSSTNEPRPEITKSKESHPNVPTQPAPEPENDSAAQRKPAAKAKKAAAKKPVSEQEKVITSNTEATPSQGVNQEKKSVDKPKKQKKSMQFKEQNVNENTVLIPVSEDKIDDDVGEVSASTAPVTEKVGSSRNEEMTTCKKCNESMTKRDLKNHHKKHYDFSCTKCSRRFGSAKGLEGHMEKAH